MPKVTEPTGEFLELLTDALRAGPGSPEWHQAVAELRKQGGGDGLDEHRMLWTARERLASGKEYRSVKAGPGFRRRLMEKVEGMPAGQRKPISVATIIAIVSLLVLIGVVAIVGYWVYGAGANGHGGSPPVQNVDGKQ